MNSATTFIFIIVSLLMFLSFAVAVIWFFTYAQKKIITTKIKQKEQEIRFQKELLSNTVAVQENERERIARELHDDVNSKPKRFSTGGINS